MVLGPGGAYFNPIQRKIFEYSNRTTDADVIKTKSNISGKKAKTKSMPLDTTSIAGNGDLGSCPR